MKPNASLPSEVQPVTEPRSYVFTIVIAITILCIGIVIGAVAYTGVSTWFTPVNTIHLTNLFVDINGDGVVDMIVSGEAILNSPFVQTPLPLP
jgi:hypothetical protein